MPNWERFYKKSTDYELYRPRYPAELLDLLGREAGLSSFTSVADVGSGTGLLSELLLRSKCNLYCVEPNEEMRRVSVGKFAHEEKCKIIEGTAENTSLLDDSMDIVTVGQAFHWFDPIRARIEFGRILKRGGKVVLIWNTITESKEGMNFEYEKLVRQYSRDFHGSGVNSTSLTALTDFYGGNFCRFKIKNYQRLSLEGMLGRYLSASYSITEDDPRFEDMRRDFEKTFRKYQSNGEIVIEYETDVFIGTINK